MINNNHYLRQLNIIHPEKLNAPILIVGAGNIGSWTALALMKMGCQDVEVVDFDIVEEHNVGSQLYNSLDIGEPKVEAMNKRISMIAETLPVIKHVKFDNQMPIERFKIVISAVDDIDVRKEIFVAVQKSKEPIMFIDGRMSANSITLYTINTKDPNHITIYDGSLFDKKDAVPLPCSARSVIYNCFIMAGYIADIVAHIANEKSVPPELEMDLTNFTLFGGTV